MAAFPKFVVMPDQSLNKWIQLTRKFRSGFAAFVYFHFIILRTYCFLGRLAYKGAGKQHQPGICPHCKTATMVTLEIMPNLGPPQMKGITKIFENKTEK